MPEWLKGVTGSALPVLTLIVGWALSQVTESRRDRRARAASTADRLAARQETAEDKRAEFELRVLNDLAPALSRYGRAVGRCFIEDVLAARKASTLFGAALVEHETSEELRLAGVELLSLAQLLLRPELRAALLLLHSTGVSLHIPAKPVAEAEQIMADFTMQLQEINSLIGGATRKLYGEK